jgi:hypothetical protein
MKRRRYIIAGICLLIAYVGSYGYFYAGRGPAANLGYWVYLRGGDVTEKAEWTLYYLYYPVYKMHRLCGAGRHNYDRGITLRDGLYDGDEPK